MNAMEHKGRLYSEIQCIIDENHKGEYTPEIVNSVRQVVLMDEVCKILERLDKLDDSKFNEFMEKGEYL